MRVIALIAVAFSGAAVGALIMAISRASCF